MWPGDTPFTCGWTTRREDDASVNLATVTSSLHAGTHADAGLHLESSWPASEALDVSAFVGEVEVIALPPDHDISRDIDVPLLHSLLGAKLVKRVLMRTGRSVQDGTFPDDWATLDVRAAEWLVERGICLWGVDAPSVDRRPSKRLPVHHALLGRGVFILENLALRGVQTGRYELLAAPLAIEGADAAPARALLRTASESR